MKTKYVGKLPKHTEPPEALKKALEKAKDERARKVARETADALTALHKKTFKVKPHGGRIDR